MVNYEPKRCVICGKEFTPKRSDQRTCLDMNCKREVIRQSQIEYRKKNYSKVLESNRKSNARRKEERKMLAKPKKPDTIIAIGYAERQIQQSLKMAGKVRTEL